MYKDKSTYTLSHNKKLDIIEDVTILELKIVNEAKNITNQDYKEIDEIIEDTEERIKSEIRTSNFGIGDLLTKGKLLDLQTILRTKLCDLEKEQAKTIDLFWEIIEGIENEQNKQNKTNKGRPKNIIEQKQSENYKIENYFKNQVMDLD